ncbi:MAG: hypothetical protein K8T25_11900 [Planctomycetia bacterium]|nr:hypothetical protein [Planctomycetia bacterium]
MAKQPGNVDYVVRLSVIYEAQNKPAQCRKMLEPLAARLGTTEGARVLGQIYARENEPDKSHELLMPYAQKRLKQLHDAEQNFTAVYKRVATRVIDMLKQERAPGFSYDRYKSLPEPQREAMVDEYIQSQIKDDPELMRARDELAAQGQVVPVALDLGVVLLERAQRKQDPQARQADLHEAEQMFLAVRGQAGEQDMYRLYLGQVDYWLGKHDEGRKLFDELMAAHQDKGEVVLAVARTLREVGAASEARQLAEKLYQKESEPKLKYAAATMISLTTDEPDEKILWLRRGDPNDKGDKATLEWLVGLQCRRRGADDEALQHLHASIDLYQGLVENSDTLNNSALVWFSLADATGDPDDFKQAAIRLEKASALGRSDSILLLNTSVALMTSALSDAVAKAIDLKMLHTTGNFELLSYLYHDAAQRKQLVANMQRNPDLRRSLEYLDKVMLLAPRSVSGYGQAYRFYGFSRDLTALKALANRLKPLELDLATQHARTLKFYSGQLDAEQLEDFQKSLPRLRRTLAAARAKGGPTLAAAAGSLCDGLAQASKVGYATDADELVRLAEEAQHAAPSAGSDSDLFTALTFRAARDLAKADPEFAAMQQRARRSLDSRMLIAAAIGRPGPLRERILANADVKRVEQMLLNNMRLYPESANGWQWAVLSASHPAEANQLAAIMRRDEISRLEIELARRLSPLSVDAAWEEYWMKQAADEPNPTAALKQCQQAGAPLPWEIK